MNALPPLPDEEDLDPVALFREAVADARPVRDGGRVTLATPKPKPVPVHSQRDEDEALREALEGQMGLSDDIEIGEAETYARHGIPLRVQRDLRHGRWAVQARIDLHGMGVEDARLAVVQFLLQARRAGQRCVLVIHGKGLGSAGGEPLLRTRVRGWLMQKDEVLAFCDAPPGFGGSGAALVLLKGP